MEGDENIQNNKLKDDIYIPEKIEIIIQQQYNITIPALYLEYLSLDNKEFEMNDLKNIYSNFGEIMDFYFQGKISVVLYNTFFNAETCRLFLQNEKNYKDNMKNQILIRWFDYDKDIGILPDDLKNCIIKIHNKNIGNIKENTKDKAINIMPNNKNLMTNINNSLFNKNINNINQNQNIPNSNNIFRPQNPMIPYNQIPINSGINLNNINNIPKNAQNLHTIQNLNGIPNMLIPSQYNIPLFMNQNINSLNNIMNIQMNNHQFNPNQKQYNQNLEEKNYGKFTCKYEILIPNDKEFQVARRLIGSKGYNMKKILNECKQNNGLNDNIKLRLRGRGSGYKEGPQNKESDEPLHLCISAKSQEEMKKACALVDSLLNKIYDEYKTYCLKNNITPVATKLANKIDCGNSMDKMK